MAALSAEVQGVVEHARRVLHDGLDGLAEELRRASGDIEPVAKADGTPVTEMDHEVDERLRALIAAALPSHGVLSEEGTTVVPYTEWCWVIDPIDGTSNFTAGLPFWCISVALALRGEVVFATIDAPALRRRYEATLGEGAMRNGRPVRVREMIAWDDATMGHVPVMLTTGTARRARQAGVALNPRVLGSTALDMAFVAEGVAAASVAVIPHVWDIAAGSLIVREAGGAVVTLDGDELLPLRVGEDHLDMFAPTATGVDADAVRLLAKRLLPD